MSAALRADCVVVGGGPAGSTTAMLLARAGFAVVLLEHRDFPRAKPCGDCISPRANLLLDELGLLDAVSSTQPAQLAGWRIHAPSGRSFTARFPDASVDPRLHYGLALSRERLDAVLLDAARAAGVDVRTSFRVEQLLNGNGQVRGVRARAAGDTMDVEAPLTIGADGLRSVVRQRLGLAGRGPELRKVALTAHVAGVSLDGDLGEMHLQDGACLGIAPVDTAGYSCNVTLVVDAKRFGRTLAGKSRTAFREHIRNFPGVHERLPQQIDEPLLASGPFDRPAVGVVTSGAALVGDAAGYFDPFTGQGIYQALAGARTLARHATVSLHARKAHEPLLGYAREHRELIVDVHRLQRLIEAVCCRPRLAERCIDALAHAPTAAQRLIAVTGDLEPPRSLLSPAVATSFLLGFTTRSAFR